MDLGSVTRADFEPHRESAFRVRLAGDAAIDLVLVSVDALRSQEGLPREPFSLIFRGPTQPILSQKMYALSHDALGELSLFLVPIGSDADGTRYEAVFS